MGLLSDPEYGSIKWIRILKKVQGPLCIVFYIAALVWFVVLGNKDFNNEAYFSENALLPGLVKNEFNEDKAARQYYNEFVRELEDKYSETGEMPVPWLVGKMSQINLEVYTHNFTLNYPLGQGQVFKGVNVYGILRAPRAASLEALVVSAPYRPLGSHQKGTVAGIALMIAFAKFARSKKYWAKDIIFLVNEHEQLGMQAWLEAYHGIVADKETFYTSMGSFWQGSSPNLDLRKFGLGDFTWSEQKCLDPGKLRGRSGSIQAAINLELNTPHIKYIEVKVEGLNGQLPNLDLVNLVHKLCGKSEIHHSFKNSFSWIGHKKSMDYWMSNVKTMLGMVTSQIAGVPNGNHGLFHRFGIEAVTLEGREQFDPAGTPPMTAALANANFQRLGTLLESTLRSLNNLLERFHQSYFFYVLAGIDRFISIGEYMPSLDLLCMAMLVKALALWVASDQELPKPEVNYVGVGVNYLLVHLIGYATMNSPIVLSNLGEKYLNLPPEMSVYNGLIGITILIAITSPYLVRVLHRGPITKEEMSLVNVLVLIELATVCLAVGMHNFPLGLTTAALYTPLALLVDVVTDEKSWRNSVKNAVSRVVCLLMQPICAVTVGMIMYSSHAFPEDDFFTMISRGKDAAMQAIMFSVVDSMIYGNWLFNVAASLHFPIWILFWQILCNKVAKT